MEFLFTKDQNWLDKWDCFLQETERGLYNQLSDWIKSYEVYGFDYNFLIVTKNDKIIGGCGIVIAKFSFLKFFSVPCGPVIAEGEEDILDSILIELEKNAKKESCCCFQISLPIGKDGEACFNYNLNEISKNSIYWSGQKGTAFKYVIPLYGLRIVDLTHTNGYEQVFSNYSTTNKRNIKKANQKNFEFKFVTSDQEIQEAYHCFVLNALDKGYPLRSFESMSKTLRLYIDKDFAKMACCYFEGKIIGALYAIRCGQRLTYINGGVLKEYQQLNVSNYLHDKMIQYSIEKKYKSYDLSVGGSEGVIRFKESFGSILFLYEDTRHWVLRPIIYKMFLFVEKYLKPHKNIIAKLLIIKKTKLKKNKK